MPTVGRLPGTYSHLDHQILEIISSLFSLCGWFGSGWGLSTIWTGSNFKAAEPSAKRRLFMRSRWIFPAACARGYDKSWPGQPPVFPRPAPCFPRLVRVRAEYAAAALLRARRELRHWEFRWGSPYASVRASR